MGVIKPGLSVERINLANEADFDLGPMRVKPSERAVELNGGRQELQPRVMQVLVALAAARPAVVSRDKLVEQCWDGRIVGDDALNRCILALRHLAQEFTPPPFVIETVPRVGHRLVEGQGEGATAAAKSAATNRWRLPAAALAILVAAGGLFFWQQTSVGPDPASIAVLPFRNLSAGDPYFAEGIGEEIMGQLAREPEFRVAGSASAAQFSGPADPRKVGRVLGVDYILEGSVRSDQGRLRVSAALVKTSDGMRLWSETYDRKIENVLEIQTAIGQAVANGLSRKLVNARTPRPINGEAYALYLNARGLIRSGNPQSGRDAIPLLQEAIRLDPRFAPAWSSMGEAMHLDGRTKDIEGLIAVLPRAQNVARRALQIDPNDSAAHGVLADLLGSDTPEGLAHLKRAAELDPRSGQGQLWRGAAHYISGEYSEGLAAYERALQIDPLWANPVRVMVDIHSGLGDRRAAEAVARRGFVDDPMLQEFAIARAAWLTGDFSEAARRWSIIAKQPSSRWSSPAKLSLEDVQYLLKLSHLRPSRPLRPGIGQNRQGPRVWMDAAPSVTEWQSRNRSSAAALVNHDLNVVAAKRMLQAGRARELVATYYRPAGLLYMRPGVPVGVCDLHEAPLVALALRQAGRTKEAQTLVAEADRLIRTVYARGATVPTWFEADAAALWAVQGNAARAISALERSFRRGYVHSGRTDLPTLAEEPAFQSLRGNRSFEALLEKYRAHYARERQETARVLKLQA